MSFLSLSQFERPRIAELLALARSLEAEPINDRLKGKILALVFMNPSVRTLASFQAGMAQLGGTSVVIQPGNGAWQFETRDGVRMDGSAQEHIREAIPVLAQYADALGVRCFAEGKDLEADLADGLISKMAALCDKPFVNLESASDHPCQALADWKTLDDLQIPEDGNFTLSWAYHPKPLPFAVPRAALLMAAQRGMNVTVMCPEGYSLPASVLREAADFNGGRVRISHELKEGMAGAHVLYCKSWARPDLYGDPEAESKAREPYRGWCVDETWFEPAVQDAKFMHCLPVRRNVKVKDEVLDGPRSVVLRQAGNRLHVQKAVLMSLLGEDQ